MPWRNFYKINELLLWDFGEENLYKIIIEDKEIVYDNPDKENKNLTIDSTCWAPFDSMFFLNYSKEIEAVDISISVSQGVKKFISPPRIRIGFSEEVSKKLDTSIIKKLFECLEKTQDLPDFINASPIFV